MARLVQVIAVLAYTELVTVAMLTVAVSLAWARIL
jgi:hypothetical protein